MKDKLFYLLGFPLVWFVVATITACPCADKVYVLAVAPSAWLLFFESKTSVTLHQLQFAGLPVMFIVGLVLLKLRMKPSVIIISSVVITFILWVTLLVLVRHSAASKVPGAVPTWLLCCFNLSLCLLPFFALPIKLVSRRSPAK